MAKRFTKRHSPLLAFAAIGICIFLILLLADFEPANQITVSDADPAEGQQDAPITIVIFGNPNCPYTRQFFTDIYPGLKRLYIDQGKARLVYKEFPREEPATTVSEADLCAHAQGKFFAYTNLTLHRQESWKQNISLLNDYAQEMGLDIEAFDTCLRRHVQQEKVKDDVSYGQSLGVSNTPTIYMNGLKFGGTPSWEDFQKKLGMFR